MGLVHAGLFLYFGNAVDPSPLPRQSVELTEQEHEVACVAEVQASLLAVAREIGAGGVPALRCSSRTAGRPGW